ncbi:hypothetical protein ACELLULO517_26495 [Acidisoma cellulosilytica]|uniref:Uncharacterized protein n=1 Tax=Acidisoma cellulosilyticum TaxID=2802395 RepID=A0A963Z7A7_9PROT|nr:hypothetical protein [Acidisoma cellulosilyticum]MCB8883824.1 hypothetical protein [Acidisoma cellulosilyticum]
MLFSCRNACLTKNAVEIDKVGHSGAGFCTLYAEEPNSQWNSTSIATEFSGEFFKGFIIWYFIWIMAGPRFGARKRRLSGSGYAYKKAQTKAN